MMWQWIEPYLSGGPSENAVGMHFAFNGPLGIGPAVGLLALVATGTAYYYAARLGRVPRRDRIALMALRTATVTLVLFLLLDPCLVGELVHPGEEAVALLFDDSRSMQVRDAQPDRLSLAKRELLALIDNMPVGQTAI